MLVLFEFMLFGKASRNPNESYCHQDKHKAPTPPHIRPLSLQDGATRIPRFGCQKSSGRRGRLRPLPLPPQRMSGLLR